MEEAAAVEGRGEGGGQGWLQICCSNLGRREADFQALFRGVANPILRLGTCPSTADAASDLGANALGFRRKVFSAGHITV
jgi:hypothetical protein